MKTISLKNSTVSLLKEGIITIHLKANTEIHVADAVLIVEAMQKLSMRKKRPVLIEAGEFCNIDREVREFSASEESNIYTLADAIAYNSLAQKMVADFYIHNNKPTVPTKLFSATEDAMNWLKTFLK